MMFTNEEKRVDSYTNESPTIPGSVSADTPLESLNLNWREQDLRERERTKHVHRLHPYLGKYIPQLVEIFLRKYFVAGQTIFDPFVGSGTTLVQANELGINSIGCDISAFNVLLSSVKAGQYDLSLMRREATDILEKVRVATQSEKYQMSFWETNTGVPSIPDQDNGYLNTWFAPQALRELLVYRYLIDHEGYRYQSLLKVILSRSARSSRLTTHFDLDFPKKPQTEPYWCYKHSRECTPTDDAFKFLQRYTTDTIRRVTEFSLIRTDASVSVHHENSQSIKLPKIDGVITSPPYVGLIDYHEQHAYAYHLLGLQDRRDAEIGPAARGSSQKVQREYQRDISKVFQNALSFMPPGGRLIVVAGDRRELYGEIANKLEVDVEGIVKRHVNRRTGRRASDFYESVFIWRKK